MSNEEDIMGNGPVKDDRPIAVRVEEAYRQGASDIEICKILKITQSQFRDNYDRNSQFRLVVDLGRVYGHAWWLEQGRKNITNRNFNTPLWVFNMKNRYNWADKTENTNQEVGPENIDELRQKLVKAVPELLKQLAPEMTQAQLLNLTETEGGTN